MDRAGERAERVGDGVDRVVAEQHDVAGAQLPPAGGGEPGARPAVERVVLLPAVEPDGRPHQVVVRPKRMPGAHTTLRTLRSSAA